MAEELKPCPFCGGKATIHRWEFHDGGYVENCAQIRCTVPWCDAQGYAAHECRTQDEVDKMAIAAWNRRAES